MKTVLWTFLFLAAINSVLADITPSKGVASWYGEDHRGRLMANGRKFNPDRLTAASWFYPLGTRVRVTLRSENKAPRSVLVTITDRGPAKDLVRDGRIIDLTHAAFKRLGRPGQGLVAVTVEAMD
jgi:rare lipoprotein A